MLGMAFTAMMARLVVLQTIESPAYARLAERQREQVIPLPAERGAILDRDGRALAISVDYQMIYADPVNVTRPRSEAEKIARVLGARYKDVLEALQGRREGSRFEYVARAVPPKLANEVRRLDLPGIYMKDEPKRVYPGGRLASHVLGFINSDGSVATGLELQYGDVLEGVPGEMRLEEDPLGHPLPQAQFSYDPPKPGTSIFLTIDKEIQYYTELTLKEAVSRYHAKSGTAIVMRPRSGEIVAMANVPDFDPNRFSESSEVALRNRAVTDVYEPGSAFKIVPVAAALETGAVTPRTVFVVPDQKQFADRVIHDAELHPTEPMTVKQIVQMSSNVGTVEVALKLGGARLQEYIKRFGFGEKSGLDFPGESPGIVLRQRHWSGSTIANLPIGQGIAVTPLQLLCAYATLANQGVWVEPKLLSGTMGADGRMRPSPAPARHRVLSDETSRQMTGILQSVVRGGTGVLARIPGYDVAGKTGTAQIPANGHYTSRYMATFTGFAPARNPQLVAIVVLENPYPIWGGSSAAPTFKKIMEFSLRHLSVPPSHNAARDARRLEEAGAGAGHD